MKQRTYTRKLTLAILTFVAFLMARGIDLILPDKYFYDANRVNSMVLKDGRIQAWEGSYAVTANVFRALNFADLTTVTEWGILIGLIGTIIVALFLLDSRELSLLDEIFWLMSVVLLNIYTLNICKDAIQFIFFVCMLIVILVRGMPTSLKLGLLLCLLIIDGLEFRSYYILIAVFFILFYGLVVFLKPKTTASFIVMGLIVSVLFLLAIYVLLPSQYSMLSTARSGVNIMRENDEAAQSMMNNLIPGSSLGVLIINFPIYIVRLLFPIEMAIRGPLYILFFIYQLLLDYYLFLTLQALFANFSVNKSTIMLVSLYIAFVVTCSFFEPDFGSWLRHEITAFPIFQALFFSKSTAVVRSDNRQPAYGLTVPVHA
ncbi:hypothetical protein PG2006B_1475 [Bifidobacterium animalis subsp. animalis]|uniref:hypothetical protein n=1 Tax=Bifidobacterium animalis TaxID=28025 RepID=UPI001020261E|nr:hypothetical protein [Bifidobacterium animalis]RYN12184.1 hypothetical protein PG2006B_1475 [Bifidobacterium animalis subsp. animalis]